MPLIDCRNITKVYFPNKDNETKALAGVSLKINAGEFVAIVGPSGSGKSTLMHILGALDVSTAGEYFLDGRDVSKLSEDQLAAVRSDKIGFVFQSFNLLPRATALRNVMLPLIYTDLPLVDREQIARESLKNAGLDETRYDSLSNQLSGGQMQRVAIARALVNNPPIILGDEPTGNLDQKTGRIVLETFQRLNDEGRTIILITHDMEVAKHARRVIQIRDGLITSDTTK